MDVLETEYQSLFKKFKKVLKTASSKILGFVTGKTLRNEKEITAFIDAEVSGAYKEVWGKTGMNMSAYTGVNTELYKTRYPGWSPARIQSTIARNLAGAESMLKSVKMFDFNTLNEMLVYSNDLQIKRARGVVLVGLKEGQPLSEIKGNLLRVLPDSPYNSAIADTYVSELSAQSQANMFIQDPNIKGFTNVVYMDSRTADVCKAQHGINYYPARGETFENFMIRTKNEGKQPTRHFRCRCRLLPLLK